ncbi:MAG TPA: GNAT family N-acetyltransferase [Feifaniaceae bacterium]|nr:GNAT family N-acetyltransferase [Feifaniaceae bacterium]
MQLAQKELTLKDGTPCLLKTPLPEDAEQFLSLMKTAAAETVFLLRYPEEVTLTAEEERDFLQDRLESPGSGFLSAWVNGRLVGNASFQPVGPHRKVLHRAGFGIAILKEYWGRGLGGSLTREILLAAKSAGYEQLELEVVGDNARAIALYEACGFVRYGMRPNAFRLKDGSYADEHLMVRKL